jgi:hypothetical protein
MQIGEAALPDKFRINVYQRIMLVFQPLFLLVMLALNLWTSLHLQSLSKWETILFPALLSGLTVWTIIHLFRWFSFEVELSDKGINVAGTRLKWEDLESAHAAIATHFSSYSTLIELHSRDGRKLKIPACVQRSASMLREIQKRLPDAG